MCNTSYWFRLLNSNKLLFILKTLQTLKFSVQRQNKRRFEQIWMGKSALKLMLSIRDWLFGNLIVRSRFFEGKLIPRRNHSKCESIWKEIVHGNHQRKRKWAPLLFFSPGFQFSFSLSLLPSSPFPETNSAAKESYKTTKFSFEEIP